MVDQSVILHATCVVLGGHAVLITGPSASGKSALALQLMALGAKLVADDRTVLTRKDDRLIAGPPATIAGMVEARGVGILEVEHVAQACVHVVVDMAQLEVERLPQPHVVTLLDIPLPCLHKVDAPYFPAAICAYLQGHPRARPDEHF